MLVLLNYNKCSIYCKLCLTKYNLSGLNHKLFNVLKLLKKCFCVFKSSRYKNFHIELNF